MSRWSFIFWPFMGSAFACNALWSLTRPAPAIQLEVAFVTRIQPTQQRTTTFLNTTNGKLLRCDYTKAGGCSPNAMKKLLREKTPALVWHDGTSVVQVYANSRTIMPYRDRSDAAWFSASLSFIFFLFAGVQAAISLGIINRPTNTNQTNTEAVLQPKRNA